MTDNSASTSPPRPINRYGTMAWDHWERHRAQTLQSIDDPTTFFRDLGRSVVAPASLGVEVGPYVGCNRR